MNEYDESALAGFSFLYSTSTKKHWCLFFIIVIIKKICTQVISLKQGSSWGPQSGARMTDVAYQFNLTLLQKYELLENTFIFNLFVYVQYLVLNCCSLK